MTIQEKRKEFDDDGKETIRCDFMQVKNPYK
jgi:hypothetical protein